MKASMDSDKIEEAAACWFARRESGHWGPPEQIEFDAWLAAATAHRVEYIRVEAAWLHAARMKALGAGIASGVIPPRGVWGDVRFFKGVPPETHPPPADGGTVCSECSEARTIDTVASTVRYSSRLGSDEPSESPALSEPLVDRDPGVEVVVPNLVEDSFVPRSVPEVLCTGLQQSTSPSLRSLWPPGRESFRVRGLARTIRHLSVAAGLLLVFAGAVYTYYLRGSGHDGYSTNIGGLSTVPLPDGSHITLNTDSHIRVALAPNERRIELDKGEAFFQVAHDPTRPFVVEIGKKRVIAVGTQFSVRRENNNIRVAVTEGKVRIEDISSPFRRKVTSSVGGGLQGEAGGTTDVFLPAGSIAQTANSEILVNEHAAPQVDQILSWRNGYVVFRDTPLAEAVAEFNRYNTRQIVIEDPDIAAILVGGNFRSNNTDAFLWLIQHGFPIAVDDSGDKVILRHR